MGNTKIESRLVIMMSYTHELDKFIAKHLDDVTLELNCGFTDEQMTEYAKSNRDLFSLIKMGDTWRVYLSFHEQVPMIVYELNQRIGYEPNHEHNQ